MQITRNYKNNKKVRITNDKLFFQDKLSPARKRGVRKQELPGIDQELCNQVNLGNIR